MTIEIKDSGDCASCRLPNGTLLYGRDVNEVGECLDCMFDGDENHVSVDRGNQNSLEYNR